MNARILVCIAAHNRKAVAELCLPTMAPTLTEADALRIYDDCSKEFDANWLTQFLRKNSPGDDSVSMMTGFQIGIQGQRRVHLSRFLTSDYSHLYLTDHDCIHDPEWRSHALRLQEKYDQRPLCLYNTRAHSEMVGNTIADEADSEVIWRRFAPGVSYFLTRAHVEKLRSFILSLQHFDWQIPSILGPFATSRTSYVDHIGWGGERHPVSEGVDGGDRASNPTEWLVKKRAEIVAKLSLRE